jgi:very-short-patch-repair endonuclease
MRVPPIAHRQHHVFTRAQARAAGFDYRTVKRRIRNRDWIEVFNDVFTAAGTAMTHESVAHAAALATKGVVSHQTAARLHRLDLAVTPPVPNQAHVTTSPRTHIAVAGVVEHRLRLHPQDTTTIDGIPVTTRTRTVVDLLASLDRRDALGLLFRAVQNKWLFVSDLDAAIPSRKGMHGTPQLRELAAMTGTNAHSVAEHALHEILLELPDLRWVANAPLTINGRRLVVDVLVPDMRIVIEVDGKEFHSGADRFQSDRERQNALVSAGYTVIRLTWLDVSSRPDYVQRTILANLNLRSRSDT